MKPTLPVSAYLDDAVMRDEQSRLFRRTWLVAGAAAAVRDPGDVVAVSVAGAPLIVVRGEDGVLRAFHNACRHRFGPLVWEGERDCVKQLRCRYHGWRYGLDGALMATPGFGEAVDERGLVPVSCAVWRGLVFVAFDPAGPLEAALGGLPEAAAAVPFESFEIVHEARHPLACNWKAYVENYLEGWHIPFLHPALVADIDVSAYEVRAGDTFCTHHAPPRDGSPSDGFWAWLWPNTAINVYRGGMSLERILPTGPDTMEIAYTYLFAPDVPQAERERAMAASLTLTHEDRQVCEAVQRGMASRAFETGLVSPRHEQGLARFYELWRAAVTG